MIFGDFDKWVIKNSLRVYAISIYTRSILLYTKAKIPKILSTILK